MSDPTQFSDTLSRSEFLAGISKHEHTNILGRGKRIKLNKGKILFREGDPAIRIYIVLKGRLKLYKLHEQGKEAIIRYINCDELTAAIAVFKNKAYPVTAETVGEVEVIGWDKATMHKLMLEYAPIAINMLNAAISRIDDLQTRYLELCTEQVEQRVGRSLLRIMKQSGRKTKDGILIDFKLSRQDLADYTGTTLFTVSRILSNWEKTGWIKSGRERITITDPHALVSFSELG
ncbi:MAG: Crp/Fnr family transcriptional regulator [Chloroflexi bacterium]|nr:Crp/Fnr family transcriptional regulator [Chloroflexota bacterium]